MKQQFSFQPTRVSAALVATILLLSLVVGTITAAATFGATTGPTWLDPGYEMTVDVTAMSAPQHHVCITYAVNGGSDQTAACTCTSPACDPVSSLGTWVCTIPSNQVNSTIIWDISAFPGSSCTGTKAQGPIGNFNTGPTAVTLSQVGVSPAAAHSPSVAFIALMLTALSGLVVCRRIVARPR